MNESKSFASKMFGLSVIQEWTMNPQLKLLKWVNYHPVTQEKPDKYIEGSVTEPLSKENSIFLE